MSSRSRSSTAARRATQAKFGGLTEREPSVVADLQRQVLAFIAYYNETMAKPFKLNYDQISSKWLLSFEYLIRIENTLK
jgi:hypothetical protein